MRTYAVVIHEDPAAGFWGEVPALPACYSQGETVDELKDNIREAIAGVLVPAHLEKWLVAAPHKWKPSHLLQIWRAQNHFHPCARQQESEARTCGSNRA